MSKSIVQKEKECFLCRYLYGTSLPLSDGGLEEHHIFRGANRNNSEHYGLKVWLCPWHHRTGPQAVHNNKTANDLVKMFGHEAFVKEHSEKEFRDIFGFYGGNDND